MINEKELLISNKSYTNKDFPVVYLELLEMIKTITNKWDPETSNESDPGIVLLKLLAFIADKLNYNIDKNLLERFMLSATQATSMRELCEMMGYEMNYYVSATTKITFAYAGQEDENGEQVLGAHDYFVIPQFTTITSANSDVHYVTIADVRIDAASNYTGTVSAMEGDLNTLTANDSEVIRLENLDDSLRVYFPVPNVAQNGVFIRTVDADYTGTAKKYWTRSHNLNSEALGQNVYKFGFDSRKGRPYVEFPSDIAALIKSGLFIQYITTNGKDGNVRAKYLTVLESPTTFDINNSSDRQITFTDEEGNSTLGISNFSASINGADPETIDEAYNGFKKTVGTFDTLVTCRDYMNAIYNMLDEDEFPLVSNVNAADRRTDINFACKITSFNEFGTYTITSPLSVTIDGTAYTIQPFDLCLYPLNPIYSYSENGTEQFVQSFKPLGNTFEIKARLENGKSISHNYVKTYDESGITYAIKNYLTLNVNVSTVNKVYSSEQADIIKNIQLALVKNFNSRQIDYGYEIPFDTLLKVIQEADTRITSVSLAEPVLKTYAMTGKGDEVEISNSSDIYYKLVAMNVLAGKVPLFDYDSEFNYDIGQVKVSGASNMKTSNGLKSVTTLAAIPYTRLTSSAGYTLNSNEVVQLLAPSYSTTDQYPAYCLFSFFSPYHTGEEGKPAIPNGTIYKLREGEYLYMNYKTDSQNITNIYKEGDIIQPVGITAYNGTDVGLVSINPDWFINGGSHAISLPYYRSTLAKNKTDLGPTGMLIDPAYIAHPVVEGEPDMNRYLFNSLTANESINIKKRKEIKKDKAFYCYWIVNNTNNKLFPAGVDEITLGEGEYFFYTDYTFTNLITVGSGTTIRKHNVTTASNWEARQLDYVEIEEKGLLGLRDYWNQAKFSEGGEFKITENTILTLTEEDNIAITGFEITYAEYDSSKTYNKGDRVKHSSAFYECNTNNTTGTWNSSKWDTLTLTALSNDFVPFSGAVSYQIKGEDAANLDAYDVDSEGWKIRSRLDINAGYALAQPILENQSMTFICYDPDHPTSDATTYSVSSGSHINLSELTQVAGGKNIDLSQYDFVKQKSIYPINVYNYTLDDRLVSRDIDDYASITFNKGQITEYTYRIPNLGERAVLMIYFVADKSSDPNATITVTAHADTGTSAEKFALCSNATLITSLSASSNKIYCLDLNNSGISGASTSISKLTFALNSSQTSAKGTLIIDKIRYIKTGTGITGINPLLDISNVNKLMTQIRTLDSSGNFYYTTRTNNDTAINLDKYDKLSDPHAYYDFNNIANRFTLSEIDFSSSIIAIARSSRR